MTFTTYSKPAFTKEDKSIHNLNIISSSQREEQKERDFHSDTDSVYSTTDSTLGKTMSASNLCSTVREGKKRTRTVFLYGSSFNPPTLAHRAIVQYFSSKCVGEADELWILPVYKHIFSKDSKLIDYETRMKMARLAFWDMEKVTVSYIERVVFLEALEREKQRIENEGKSEEEITKNFKTGTAIVLNYLKNKYPNTEFKWVMGADNFKDFHKWRNPQAIVDLVQLQVFDRDGMLNEEETCAEAKKNFGQFAKYHNLPKIDNGISSTNARAAETIEKVQKHVQLPIAKFMQEQHLYGFVNVSESS